MLKGSVISSLITIQLELKTLTSIQAKYAHLLLQNKTVLFIPKLHNGQNDKVKAREW